MVCSTCGYENQAGNRFCGMCGTPLPHRPLTTPGAQSTASLTRALGENVGAIEPRTSSVPPARTNLDVEPRAQTRDQRNLSETPNGTEVTSEPPGPDESTLDEHTVSGNVIPISRDGAPSLQRSKAAPPPFDLVPEIPLDQYVQNFRYVPPSDPEEITMRGEATVSEPEPPAPSDPASVAPAETAIASAEAASLPSTDDVRERLGLEVTTEERADRPRFLDFNEPPVPSAPTDSKLEASATPIAGPSFLGVSDVPPVRAATSPAQADTSDEKLGVEEPAPGNWRLWLAVAAVLAFGVLGALEWRAQVRQTNNGPVELIKAKVWDLTHPKPPQTAGTESTSPAAPADSASKSAIQVKPPSGPLNQNSPETTATSTNAKSAAPVPNTNASTSPPASSVGKTPASSGNQPQSTATPPQNSAQNAARTPAGQNADAAKPTTTTPPVDKPKSIESQQPGPAAATAANKPKPPPAADDNDEVVVKKTVPGAEEVAKADNASDSAAEAAWLWKATAKGNPTAPVRLADMYVKGDGVPRSCEQAVVLLKTAAEKDNALACNRLASMYSSGTCVQRDRVEAYRWLSSALAANPNSDWARQNRDLLWQQMTPEERGTTQPPH
ncbi:MAG: zinc-ribbon domain-containing protein [Candidatus Korobacteraceae bacterium]